MKRLASGFVATGIALACGGAAGAQVFSPVVLRQGQEDASSLTRLAESIYRNANAATQRQKAEAIWRFFLTDGRFVKPGFWYHIAGWAYEEPGGEVLDAIKLLNSYGFGLCYHIAPLLEAVYEAGGFPDARVWFLTGHTVAEVFYDGAYHYYDSDMMGYNPAGEGDFRKLPVASVHQVEQNGNLILGKLQSPVTVKPGVVDSPWYPADLQERAIPGLAELFTTTEDNRLFPYTRYETGHSMDFVLRPGEKMTRFFRPESRDLYYLPYRFDGQSWQEFPVEFPRYRIRTGDGPHSQRDRRLWGTGRIEYTPMLGDRAAYYAQGNENLRLPDAGDGMILPERPENPASAVFSMPSPYVIIDAAVRLEAKLATGRDRLVIETSRDDGRSWTAAGSVAGPHHGPFEGAARVLSRSGHGVRTAVSGSYGYLVRLRLSGQAAAGKVTITTRFQLNPRTLPALQAGRNHLTFRSGPAVLRHSVPAVPERIGDFAFRVANGRYFSEKGLGLLIPESSGPADFVFEVAGPDGRPLTGVDAGGRFLDLRNGIAPDKLTAEVRKTTLRLPGSTAPEASLAWAASPQGPFHTLWTYGKPEWRDGKRIGRLLLWPEVDRQIRDLPPGTRKVWVRYRVAGMALDNIRLASLAAAGPGRSPLAVTHVWNENGARREHTERIDDTTAPHAYTIAAGEGIVNEAVILSCPAR